MGYTTTLLDEESEEDSEGEKVNNVVSFKACVRFKSNDQDDGE